MTRKNHKALIEALLFASSKPLTLENLAEASGLVKPGVREIIAELTQDYDEQGRGFGLYEIAAGYQLRSLPAFSENIAKLFQVRSRRRFTRVSLETLSIIAYRQPVTRAEIEQIRGVDSGAVLKTLLTQAMIRVLGRKEAPGRPILYGTTREFLEYFGLRDIESLPTLEEITELHDEEHVSDDAEMGGHGDAERSTDAGTEGRGDAEEI
jgi:segregation and condensation protein B